MTDLEQGLYFVRRKLFPTGIGEPEIAEYKVGFWHFLFDTNEYQDNDIAEIGERVTKKQQQPTTTNIIINENCNHLKFAIKAKVEMNFDVLELSLISMIPTTPKYTVKMSVQCNECGIPFHFTNPLSPSTSIDGTELRIGILPGSLTAKSTSSYGPLIKPKDTPFRRG